MKKDNLSTEELIELRCDEYVKTLKGTRALNQLNLKKNLRNSVQLVSKLDLP